VLYTVVAYWLNGYVCAMRRIPFYIFLLEARARVWLWVNDIDREGNVLCFRQRAFNL